MKGTALADVLTMKLVMVALYRSVLFKIAGLLLLLFPAGGCVHASHLKFIVPSRCAKVSIEDFTRPCHQLADGKLLCNAVVVSVSCIQAPPPPTGKSRF